MQKKISVILFTLIILLIPVISMLSPYKTVSVEENRGLASFPEFNFDTFTSKRFMSGFQDFISDHIAFRDQWVAVKADAEILAGKRDNNGVYLGDNCLIQNIKSPGNSIYSQNVDAINEFAKRTGKPTFLLLAPTAAGVEQNKLPAFAETFDQKAFIKSAGESLKGVKLVNTFDTLTKHNSEYIYYRTDHHWTSLGAYYAYKAAAGLLGYTPLELKNFTVRHQTTSFNGTLYSKSGYRCVTPDTIDIFTPKSGSNLISFTVGAGKDAVHYKSIYFTGWLSQKDKYSVFLNGNQPLEDINTTAKGKKLLIIKDSYAHSLVPFLMNNYSRITLADMRYLVQPLDEAVNLKDYDQVLFIYNVDDFNTDTSIQAVN